MHPTDMQCLHLLELMGPLTPGKLAECTGSEQAASPSCSTGEKAGFARREGNPADRRSGGAIIWIPQRWPGSENITAQSTNNWENFSRLSEARTGDSGQIPDEDQLHPTPGPSEASRERVRYSATVKRSRRPLLPTHWGSHFERAVKRASDGRRGLPRRTEARRTRSGGILDDPRSGRLGTLKMSFDVFDEYGQALGPETEPSRTGFSQFCLLNHDVSIADMQLRPVDWLPITEMLNKSESADKPVDGCGQVLVDDVRQEWYWQGRSGWRSCDLHLADLLKRPARSGLADLEGEDWCAFAVGQLCGRFWRTVSVKARANS